MKAFVLCGGIGTRLRPYTYNIPKPMLPLGRKPILEFVVSNLKAGGITDLIFTVGYLKEQIRNHFGDGKDFGVKIRYLEEKEVMNTAGSILPGKPLINDTFAVVMGDHLTSIDLKKMVEFHKERKAIATIGLKKQGVPLEYGIASIDEDKVVSFKEKPILENYVNAAVYIFEPKIFNYIKDKEDFAKDVFPRLMAKGEKLNAYVFDDYWVDIGRIHDYEYFNQIISIVDLALSNR